MSESETHELRRRLREVLRVARFEAWTLDALEDEIARLFGRGVDDQPAPTPDQLAGPLPA